MSNQEYRDYLSHENSGLTRPVQSALDAYMEEANGYASPDTQIRIQRIADLVTTFAPEELSLQAFEAACLQTLANHINHPNHTERNRAAGYGFLQYFRHPDHAEDRSVRRRQEGFIAAVSGDLPYIDRTADDFEKRIVEAGRGDVFDENRLISRDDWLNLRVGPNIPEIVRTSKTVNVEALIARCALQAERVLNPIEDDDMKLFRDVQRIDSFDAAVLDALGMNALSIVAASNAGRVRAIKSGNEKTLVEAQTMLNKLKQVDPDEVMAAIYGREPSGHLFRVPDNSTYDEKIVFTSTDPGEFYPIDGEGKINARFKGDGSLAIKILRNENYDSCAGDKHPMDMFGMHATLPDEQALADFYQYTAEKIMYNDSVELSASASKDANKLFFIQGSPRFVSAIMTRLPDSITRYIQVKVVNKPENRNYQVAKFTCYVKVKGITIPAEFQFQTEQDRENARFGHVSHSNHHAKGAIPGVPSEEEFSLRWVRERMERMDPKGLIVNGQSIPHGEEFNRRFRHAARLDDMTV